MEDTQNTINNDEILAEMLRDAEKADEPGDKERIVSRGDSSESPLPSIISHLSSAGYVYIYDNRNGERSVCNRNMLPDTLKKKRKEDGSYVFTTRKPDIEPARGTLTCMLHKNHPNRKHWDELGLPYCRKEHISNQHNLIQHMKHKHAAEWAAIEQERIESERQVDRGLQREILMRLVPSQESAPLYVSDKPEKNKSKAKKEATA